MTDDTKKSKTPEVTKVELPNSLEEVQALLIDEKLKAVKPKNAPNINNVEKKNNLTPQLGAERTSKEAEKTSQDLAGLKADTHLSEAEKTVTAKKSAQTPAEKADKEDKPKEEKGILDQAKDFVVDENNKPKWMNIGIVAAGTAIAYKAVSWIKSWFSDEKKEGEVKSEDKPWYKNTWLWTGAVAVGGWFARDKWGREKAEKVKNTFILKQKIELLTTGDTEKFLLKILEDHAEEIDAAGAEDLESKFTEIAKKENEKNSGLTWLAVSAALKLIFESKDEKSETEKTEEAKTEENKQNHENINQKTEEMETIYINKVSDKKITQQDIESQWSNIYKDWNVQINSNRDINKSKIINTYSNTLSFLQILGSQKNEKGVLLFPSLTNSIISHFLSMIKFMKDKNEYFSAAQGMAAIMNINNQKIPPLHSDGDIMSQLPNKDKIQSGIENCKTDEEITKYIGGIMKSEDYQKKYNTEFNKWIEIVGVHVKEPLKGYGLINDKNISILQDIGADMYGHGIFTMNDMRLQKNGGIIATISGTLITLGFTLDATGIGAIGGVPMGVIGAILGAIATQGINASVGNGFSLKDGLGDLVLNAIPGGALAKIGKGAATIAKASGGLAKAIEYGVIGLSSAGVGMTSSYIKTGEVQAGSNIGISMALAVLPYGLGKFKSKIGGISIPPSITNFSNNVISKFLPQTEKLMLGFRKLQLKFALMGKNGLSDEAKKILINDSQTLSKEMQEDIGKYLVDLEAKGMTKEADEILTFLGQSGVTEIKFHKAIKQAVKINKQGLKPNLSNINKNLSDANKRAKTDIDSLNNFIRGSDDYIVSINGEKYRPLIDENTREIVFEDIVKGGSYINSKGKLYQRLMDGNNKYITGKISNALLKRAKSEAQKNGGNQTIIDFLKANNYKLTPKISLWLTKNKQATVNSVLEYFNLDFKNCSSTGDYTSRGGKILRATTKASIFSAPVGLMASCIINDGDGDWKYNLAEGGIATLIGGRKLRLITNIIDAMDPIDYIREKTGI